MRDFSRLGLVLALVIAVLSTGCHSRVFTFKPPAAQPQTTTSTDPPTTTPPPTTTTTTPRPTTTTTPRPTTTTTTTTPPPTTTTTTTTEAPTTAAPPVGSGFVAPVVNPAPMIAFSMGFSRNRYSLGSEQVVVFEKEVSNIGQGYDISTGVFTCDVPGLYMFQLSIMGFEQSPITVRLQVNGMGKMDVAVQRTFGASSSSGTVFLQLNQGDEVAVINANSVGHKIQSLGTMFSGVLLHAM